MFFIYIKFVFISKTGSVIVVKYPSFSLMDPCTVIMITPGVVIFSSQLTDVAPSIFLLSLSTIFATLFLYMVQSNIP